MGGDPRARNDAALALLDLGVDCCLDASAGRETFGPTVNVTKQAAVDPPDRNLPVAIVEVDAEVARAAFGQFDKLGFEDHRVDRYVDQVDLLLDPRDPIGAARDPDRVEPAINAKSVAERLAERKLLLLLRLILHVAETGLQILRQRTEAWLAADEDIVGRDNFALRQQANDLADVGIFEGHQLVGIARIIFDV